MGYRKTVTTDERKEIDMKETKVITKEIIDSVKNDCDKLVDCEISFKNSPDEKYAIRVRKSLTFEERCELLYSVVDAAFDEDNEYIPFSEGVLCPALVAVTYTNIAEDGDFTLDDMIVIVENTDILSVIFDITNHQAQSVIDEIEQFLWDKKNIQRSKWDDVASAITDIISFDDNPFEKIGAEEMAAAIKKLTTLDEKKLIDAIVDKEVAADDKQN